MLPCRGFTAAIAARSPGGEVIVVDSAGYGAVTITKSVSIIAPPGVYAGISVFGGAGITVSAAATDLVTLKGLSINSQAPGTSGIVVIGVGRLQLVDVNASGFTASGVQVIAPSTPVRLLVIRGAYSGDGDIVFLQGSASNKIDAVFDGVSVECTSNATGRELFVVEDDVRLAVRNSTVAGCNIAFDGFPSTDAAVIDVERSRITGANYGAWIGGPPPPVVATFVDSIFDFNGTALRGDANSTIRISGSTITRNNVGFDPFGAPHVFESLGNNLIRDNTSNGPDPATFAPK